MSSMSKTITAPLGIVVLKKRNNAGSESNYGGAEKIIVEVRKGTYKGVHAPAYKATKLMAESSIVSKFRQ